MERLMSAGGLSYRSINTSATRFSFVLSFLLFIGLFSFGCKSEQSSESNALVSKAIDQNIPSGGNPQVVLKTKFGEITIELFPALAPITVANFLQYVDDGFYNGTIFHRIIPTFMIQGGGHLPGMSEKSTRPAIKNEATNGLRNERGTIAMARTSEVDSATAQFFINVADNHRLNNSGPGVYEFGYCVFGKVVAGMDVVDKIKDVSTSSKLGHDDVPVEDVIIEKVWRKRE